MSNDKVKRFSTNKKDFIHVKYENKTLALTVEKLKVRLIFFFEKVDQTPR